MLLASLLASLLAAGQIDKGEGVAVAEKPAAASTFYASYSDYLSKADLWAKQKQEAKARAAEAAQHEAERLAAEAAALEAALAEAQAESAAVDQAWQEAQTNPQPPAVPPAPSGSIESYIAEAAATYGQDYNKMYRMASCESTLGQNPNAYNGASGHYGLFQYKLSTWATTPYAGYDVLNDYYNAMATGWMLSQGRGGEWACQ